MGKNYYVDISLEPHEVKEVRNIRSNFEKMGGDYKNLCEALHKIEAYCGWMPGDVMIRRSDGGVGKMNRFNRSSKLARSVLGSPTLDDIDIIRKLRANEALNKQVPEEIRELAKSGVLEKICQQIPPQNDVSPDINEGGGTSHGTKISTSRQQTGKNPPAK